MFHSHLRRQFEIKPKKTNLNPNPSPNPKPNLNSNPKPNLNPNPNLYRKCYNQNENFRKQVTLLVTGIFVYLTACVPFAKSLRT